MRLVRANEAADEGNGAEDLAPIVDDAVEEALVEVAARVIALIVAKQGDILTISETGYGKRTPIEQFPLRGRGGMGVIAQALSDKSGNLIGAIEVEDGHQVMLISESGNLIRFKTTDVRTMGRNTQGVRLMRPVDGDRLVSVDRIEAEDEGESAGEPAPEAPVLE
jgi:DNA gyrase subunit A